MKQHTTKAILLKRIEFGEADRIITALTPDVGKVTLLAKGVRKSKSKLAGGLELFSTTDITYIDGKSDVKTIIGTKLDEHYRAIVGNMESTMTAYELLKLTHAFTEDEVDEEYFRLLQTGFVSLNAGEVSVVHVYVWFCIKLLELSGHAINCDKQLDGSPFKEDRTYQFSYDDMSFFATEEGPYEPSHIKLMRLLVKISRPELLLKVHNTDMLLQSLHDLVRRAVRLHT